MARPDRFSSNYANTQTPDFKRLLAERNNKLLEFPVTCKVVWKHDREKVLTVTGHDSKLGRVKVDNGQSYNPSEVEIYTET